MRINNNLSAMNTHRMGNLASSAQAKSIEKLSSGLRINKASDDAAGLAISEKMRGQIRGLNMASRNSQDAISLIQTAEGAAGNVHEILQRMRVLAVQSANDTNTSADREKIQAEIEESVKQIDYIANSTEFNTVKLLNSASASAFAGISQSTLTALTAKLPGWLNDSLVAIRDQLGITLPDNPTKRPMNITYYYDNAVNAAAASMGTADSGATLTLQVNMAKVTDASGNLKSEGILDTLIAHEVVHALEFTEMSYVFNGAQGPADENWFTEGLAMVIQGGNLFAVTDHNVNLIDPFDNDYRSAFEAVKVIHEITAGGIAAFIDRLEAGDTLDQAFNNTVQNVAGTELAAATGSADFATSGAFITWFNNNGTNGVLAYLTGSSDFSNTVSGAITTGNIQGSSSNLTLDQTILNGTGVGTVDTHYDLKFTNAGSEIIDFNFQVGANAGQMVNLSKSNLSAKGLGLDTLDYSTRDGATSAIGAVDAAITIVSSVRSNYGAIQNRLEHTIKNLDVASENLQASESRIRDQDMAKEIMQFTRLNILTQASQSLLAQANQQPQGVLQLLR